MVKVFYSLIYRSLINHPKTTNFSVIFPIPHLISLHVKIMLFLGSVSRGKNEYLEKLLVIFYSSVLLKNHQYRPNLNEHIYWDKVEKAKNKKISSGFEFSNYFYLAR